MDDGMDPQTHLNRQIVSKLVDVLGNYDPYYMQLAYTEIKLKGKVAQENKLDELEKRLSKVESNHDHTFDEFMKQTLATLYELSGQNVKRTQEVAELRGQLEEVTRKWQA